MQRLRRSTSASQEPVRQNSSETRRLERARSSNLNSRPCRRRLRRYWKALAFTCGCITVVLLSVPRDAHQEAAGTSSIFRPRLIQRHTCPGERNWSGLPPGIDIDVHVVARGNTDNLRLTLTSLAQACYPEDAKLALHVWALTAHAQEVLPAQDGFLWTHGTYQFHTLTTEHGEVPPLEGWARMWTDPSDNEVRLVLAEGLELSNLFYFWLSGTLDRYLGDSTTMEEREIFRANVFGISLSATGLSEPNNNGEYHNSQNSSSDQNNNNRHNESKEARLSSDPQESRGGHFPSPSRAHDCLKKTVLNLLDRSLLVNATAATGVIVGVSGKPLSWEAYEAADGRHPIFHTLPGARGTAFFGWQWRDFSAFMDARARVLESDSWEGESLLHVQGGEAVHSWAGSLERFMAEFSHGRGLGILHPNLNGAVSFARQVPSGTAWEEEEEMLSQTQTEGASTPTPTLRGTEEGEREPETLIRTYKDANNLVGKYPAVSSVPAYDLLFRRHPDLTHLRLLAYRFFQRLGASATRNKELEDLWRRPGIPKPIYGDAKYLIYQPQFGMGNQLRALEAALAVARVLRRMLVVPDYMADNGEGLPIRYDAIWEFGFLEELVGRNNVILQADFDAILQDGEAIQPPTKVYLLDMPIKQLTGSNHYFGRIGWGELPQVPLPLANATEAGWAEIQQMEDQVLAVSALFGMFQGWNEDSTGGDSHWHTMVKLHVSEEATWVHDFVDDSLDRFRRKATEVAAERANHAGAPGENGVETSRGGVDLAATQFMCAHVRRQDFKASCARYEEEYRSGSARDWVKEALGSGGVCWVDEGHFRDTVSVLLRRAPDQLGVVPSFVFATSDDALFLEEITLGNAVPVFTLDDVSLPKDVSGRGDGTGLIETSPLAVGQTITPEEVKAALPAIDVAVCSRGALLMLNYFSTYSALIKAKAKAQPNFVRGLYWMDPPALSNWWTICLGWFRRKIYY